MGFVLSVLLSFVPAFCYASVVYWIDRYEKEPKRLLLGVFLWGAIVAVIGALIWSGLFELSVYLFLGPTYVDLVGSSVIAPVVEESVKGLAVLIIFLVFRPEFDTILDGIVYAAVTALGFAATENVLYLYTAGYGTGGYAGLFTLFVMRVLLGGWNHAVYTSFTGIGLAASRLSRHTFVKVVAPVTGLLLAMGAHSLHNTLVTLLSQNLGGFIATLLIDWLGWLMMVLVVLWALHRERHWINTHLRDEVERGTLSETHYRTACSSWAQTAARLRALVGGRYRTTWRFYQACGELAQKKHQRLELGEIRYDSTIDSLRSELRQLGPHVSA